MKNQFTKINNIEISIKNKDSILIGYNITITMNRPAVNAYKKKNIYIVVSYVSTTIAL